MIKKILLLSVLLILFVFTVKSYASPYSVNQCFNHIKAQSYKTARTWGIRAVNNHPQSFYARMCLGEADNKLGLHKPALYDFKKAIPLANSKNKLMGVYGRIEGIYKNEGHLKKALHYKYEKKSLTIKGVRNRAYWDFMHGIMYKPNP
ncbi:MAG: hypothetical protein ACYCS0_01005 [bacterium]